VSQRREYDIQAVIGEGGFGTVLRARMRGGGGFSKVVAIKILHDELASLPRYATRLRDEARLLGLVRHRAILQVDQLSQLDGRWAVITEYIEGASLLDIVRNSTLPETVMLEVVTEVAGALHAAYQTTNEGAPLKLIHRDIKPGNIQLTKLGEVKLLDFGIARGEHEGRESETTAVLMGSPNYMSPERMEMHDLPAGDIYALGVVLCEGLTGLKFGRTSGNVERHEENAQKNLARLRQRAVNAEIVDLVSDMISYKPEERPTARDVERRCRELRGKIDGPWLGDWAPDALPFYMNRDGPSHELVGKTVKEDDPGAAKDALSKATPVIPSGRGRRRAAPAVLLVLLLVLLLGGTLTGALVYGVYQATNATPADVAPEPADIPEPVAAPVPEPDEPEPEVVELETQPKEEPVEITTARKPKPRPSSGGLVTAAQFAGFLESHPEWTRENAVAAGKADHNYLPGWDAATPPPDSAGPVTNVCWAAASAFCQGRGGLLDVNDAPLEWPEDKALMHWRTRDGVPAWRRFDDALSEGKTVRKRDSNSFTGFRCRR